MEWNTFALEFFVEIVSVNASWGDLVWSTTKQLVNTQNTDQD
jgi:hypothetical protein